MKILVFPSVLGVRPGIEDAAALLREHGHEVLVLNPTESPVSDDYDSAVARVDAIPNVELMRRTQRATADVPGPFVVLAFSHGVVLAEFVAMSRPDDVRGAVLFAGAIPIEYFPGTWPAHAPVQVHETVDDPWRDHGAAEALAAGVRTAGARAEVFSYPGSGHLFTDASKTDEFQPEESRLAWERVVEFLKSLDS